MKTFSLLLSSALLLTALHTRAESDYLPLAKTLCNQPNSVPQSLKDHEYSFSDIVIRGNRLGTQSQYISATQSVVVESLEPVGRPPRITVSVANIANGITQPSERLIFSGDCELIESKQIVYDNETALYIETQAVNSAATKEWLNPPTPNGVGKTNGLRVALIDSGVNYTLPAIADALAIDKHGKIIGYDFWDNDHRPYDANPARSAYFVQRHGTRTASILIREAPAIALVPYRYPRPDMSRMKQLVEHAAAHQVRIVGMPLGSNTYKDWLPFAQAAEAHPEILFIASAGNNGRDIDINPVYPAGLELDNLLVVTSSDDYIRPAERTNFGRLSVDYLLPAEQISATDYSGEATTVSGSSYAVARMTALAARLLQNDPSLSIDNLKTKISERSFKGNTSKFVTTGYVANPLTNTSHIKTEIDKNYQAQNAIAKNTLTINLVALDPRWSNERITSAIQQTNDIYKQCGISISTDKLIRITGPNYLSNLSMATGATLRQLVEPLQNSTFATVYFANDTDMLEKFDAEAFGIANTRSRPWMTNTVWITQATIDSGHALAHELFHVLSNSGNHSDAADNLMRNNTALQNVKLLPKQCLAAVEAATINGLLEHKP